MNPEAAEGAETELAARIGAELHRLVPAVHAAARPHGAPVLAPVRPYGGFLVDVRTLLLHGPAPLRAVRAIHRYQPGVDEAMAALVVGGWLVAVDDGDGAVVATDRCRALLRSLMTVLDRTCQTLWGAPSDLLATADALVAGAGGTSEGPAFPAFDALADAGHPDGGAGGTVAGRLFTALCALRYHRADAYAAAWAAEGLTVEQVKALAEDHPQRLRIEAVTDDIAARPYRRLSPSERAGFLSGLRDLPGVPPSSGDGLSSPRR